QRLASVPAGRAASPPLALGTGHVALLLASGHLDGVVSPEGERPHLVRGTSRKKEVVTSEEVTEDDKGRQTTKTVLTEKIELIVRAVDWTGTVRTFTEGSEDGNGK